MSLEELKKELIEIFQSEIRIIDCIRDEFDGMREENLLFAQFKRDFGETKRILEDNLKMIDRIEMKCVTFGSTSNGKSSILNALLEIYAFPSSFGRATSCFVSVQGCEDSTGYIMDKDNQRQDLEKIKQLTDANCDGHYDIHSELKVFLPQSKCRILQESVKIWDSPGIDYSEEHNEIINEHCRDTDVFLLVIDGCSTLSLTERQLFATISKIITIPSIIFLVNKWDEIKDDIRNKRQQHKDNITECFVDNLKIYKTREEISERIFFISAKVASLEDDEGVVFDRFKEKLIDDLRINATRRKLKGNMDKVSRYSEESSDIKEKIKLFVDKELKKEGLIESLEKIIDGTIDGIQTEFNSIQKQIIENIVSDYCRSLVLSSDSTNPQPLIIEMKKILEKQISKMENAMKNKFPKPINGNPVDQYLERFAQFHHLVQRFNESLLNEFYGTVELIFNDKECVEDDLSLTTILMMKDIKDFIEEFDRQNKPGWIENFGKNIWNSKISGIPFFTCSKFGSCLKCSSFGSCLNCSTILIEPLEETDKAEIIENDCQTGEELDSKSTQDTKSMVDRLMCLRKKMKEIVTENMKEKEKLDHIFKGIADTLEINLDMLMENHLKLTRSEIEENVKKCVNIYLKDQKEILEMWKRLEVKIVDKKDIADLKKKIDEC